MGRRKPRFSFLDRALKVAGNTATAGVLGEYAKFKAGDNKANTGTKDPTANQRVSYAIVPFGQALTNPATADPSEHERVSITIWSNNWRTANALTNNNVGYNTGAFDEAGSDGGYYPALLIAKGPKGPVQNKISGITKRSYKSYGAKSYTIPFGQHGTLVPRKEEYTQYNALAAELLGTPGRVSSLSFVPEEWNATQAQLQAGN